MNTINCICLSSLIALSTTPSNIKTPTDFTFENETRIYSVDKDSSYGYAYLGYDIFSTQLTDVSRLFLIYVKMSFTPGYTAYRNGHSSYNQYSYLRNGYVHIKTDMLENEDLLARGPYPEFKAGSPNSSKINVQIVSSFSNSYAFSNSFEAGADLIEGITLKAEQGSSLSLSYGSETIVNSEEPILSTQCSPTNQNEYEWFFDFQTNYRYTYTLETCYFFELSSQDGRGYTPYSFSFTIDYKVNFRSFTSPYLEHTESNTVTKIHGNLI